ncbi:MAG: lipocalin-like domain-containing protein [Haliea sp.]|uniref:lipocalin-like domain-containing protein n=1 Tax=Haliea sp. TaxID=1932666 RepID=UPI0032EAEA11
MNEGEQLQGCWLLRAYELQQADGSVVHPMGEHPEGLLLYSAAGHMSVHLLQPGASLPEPEQLPPGLSADLAMSYACYTSYFGRYTVDRAQGLVTHHLRGASVLAWAGSEFSRHYRLQGDRLTLSAAVNEQGSRAVLVWQREQ